MGFSESVKSVFSKYATFSGRATRSEYWYFYLFNILVSFGLMIVCFIIGGVAGGADGLAGALGMCNILTWIYALAVLVPGLAVGVRRLHDIGKSGWNLLWALLPLIGVLILLVFFLTDSKDDNQYGPREN